MHTFCHLIFSRQVRCREQPHRFSDNILPAAVGRHVQQTLHPYSLRGCAACGRLSTLSCKAFAKACLIHRCFFVSIDHQHSSTAKPCIPLAWALDASCRSTSTWQLLLYSSHVWTMMRGNSSGRRMSLLPVLHPPTQHDTDTSSILNMKRQTHDTRDDTACARK